VLEELRAQTNGELLSTERLLRLALERIALPRRR
jgi:hypothetical protein